MKTTEERERLLSILTDFTHDELRSFTYVIRGPGAYEDLRGTSKQDKAISLLELLEATDQIGELIELVRKRKPDIDLSGFAAEAQPSLPKQADFVSQRDDVKPTQDSPPRARSIPPEFAEKLRRRRPGYDRVYALIQGYDKLLSEIGTEMSRQLVADRFVAPMFEALGWSARALPTIFAKGGSPSFDFELKYRDLRVPVTVRKSGDSLSSYTDKRIGPWEILTNFEAILIWDVRDFDRPTIVLESSPWSYVADDREEDDLLVAEIFYERLARPLSEGLTSAQQTEPVQLKEIVSDPGQLIAEVEDGNLTPAEALAIARLNPSAAERAEELVRLSNYLPERARRQVLLEGLEAARTIEDRETRSETLIGLASHLPVKLREQVLEEARTAAQESPTEPERIGRIEIATRALADTPSEIDLLGFSDYAKALADFIKNEKTEKPLTIGVDAAWGMGKTTLMRMIRDQLAEQRKNKKHKRSFPTVWFNAWKYDQEESLWGALALEILAQVRKQFNVWQRARFWMKLNWKRFDWTLLLRSVLKSLAFVFGIGLLGAMVLGIASLGLGTTLQESMQRLWQYAKVVGGLGVITTLYATGKEAHNRIAGPFDLKISQYVREPNYEERVGFLAQFEMDFKWLIDVVTEGGKWPLVVFIDDLDRCAPPRPAEIIEAINILLDAKHCVFVIGMDAQTVAGSIEAKYKDLKEYLNDAEDPGGLTLGQRFLEKIVQINFRIPRADPKVVESFVDANLDALGGESSEEPPAQEVSEAEQLIEAEQRAGKPLGEAVRAVETARLDIPREAVAEARREVFARSFDDCEDVRHAIHEAIPYLGLNPRKIKRFINAFRLQALIANRRGLLETGVVRLDLLAKLVIIAMRWPDLIEVMIIDRSFANRLKQAHGMREKLRGVQPGELESSEAQEKIQAGLDALLADPGIKRLIDATDLIGLLVKMDSSDIEASPDYLHLTQTTVERPGVVRAEHE